MSLRMLLIGLLIFGAQAVTAEPAKAPYGVGCELIGDAFLVVWYYEGVNRQVYLNDGNEVDSYFLVDTEDRGNRALARFSGVNEGYLIESISIFLWGTNPIPAYPGGPESPFALAIFDHIPETLVDIPIWWVQEVAATNVPAAGEWCDFPVQRQLSVTELYLQFLWQSATPAMPLVAIDYQESAALNSYCGYRQGEDLVWGLITGGNLLFRLNYNLPDTLAGYSNPAGQPDSFSIYLDSDSIAVTSKSEIYMSLIDSLHCQIPIVVSSGKFLSIAAWQDEQVGSRSIPLLLDTVEILPFPLQLSPEALQVITGPDEIITQEITVSNLRDEQIIYRFAWPATGAHWITGDTSWRLLETLDQEQLTFIIDNHGLSPGSHVVNLRVVCQSDSHHFAASNFQIVNIVDAGTAVNTDADLPPSLCRLQQNYPNPFNQQTLIHSTQPEPVQVFNLLGEFVASLEIAGQGSSLQYYFIWDGCDGKGLPVASGIYFYTQYGSGSVRKMLLLK